MMFGVVFRVIGKQRGRNFGFSRFWQKSVDYPLGILVKISNLLKLSV